MLTRDITVEDFKAVYDSFKTEFANDKPNEIQVNLIEYIRDELAGQTLLATIRYLNKDPVSVMLSVGATYGLMLFEAGIQYGMKVRDIEAH